MQADTNGAVLKSASLDSAVPLSTLVILGASATGLAVARDAHRHGLCAVVADREDGPALHSRWVRAVDVSAVPAANLIERIVRLGGPHAALIATSDHWIRWLAGYRPQLSESYRLIVQPSNPTLEICLDKMAFSEWCTAFGLPSPAAWMPNRAPRPSSLAFPVLLRPVRTAHGHDPNLPKAVEARDESELALWLQRFTAKGVEPMASASLLGRKLEQYSVPFARCKEQMLMFTALKMRPDADLCQTGTYVQIAVDERSEGLARTAIERLDYFGIGEVEILRDTQAGKDYLIEINARPWLQYALAPASNHDFLGLVLGLSPACKNAPVRSGKAWIDLYQDLFVAFSRSIGMVRHGRLGLFAYLASLTRCNVFSLFDWRDLRPFLRSWRR